LVPDNDDHFPLWWLPKMWVLQNGWFLMENPIKIDDLGYLHFRKPPYLSPYSMVWPWTYNDTSHRGTSASQCMSLRQGRTKNLVSKFRVCNIWWVRSCAYVSVYDMICM
jgi:hypothetical protein